MRAVHSSGVSFRLEPVVDPSSLERLWRDLEQRAGGSFFQSWSWVGCLLAERFSDPMLMTAQRDGRAVALALCNRRATAWGETLWLGETGDAEWDSAFVEHNGPLLAAGDEALAGLCLASLLRDRVAGGRCLAARRVIVSGVGEAVLASGRGALRRACRLRQTRLAPFLDLAACGGQDAYLASLGSSTRHQLRRSARLYEAAGPLELARAGTVAEGLAFFERLVDLHTQSWLRRGKPGAFASDKVRRFHRGLIATALPRGEVDLLRIRAGDEDVGLLYNFRWNGRVSAYQSGFAHAADPRLKPGLTCHVLAIADYRAAGLRVYDFLAGDERYKTSLAPGLAPLHWLELAQPWSPRGMALLAAAFRDRVASRGDRAEQGVG